jgi:hypothetical protein
MGNGMFWMEKLIFRKGGQNGRIHFLKIFISKYN